MKVGLYCRVSTADKEQDPDLQLGRLREYCKNHGHEIVSEYVEFKSGKDWNRPELKKIMEDAKARRIEAIIVTKLDRFSRSVLDSEIAMRDLGHWKVAFITMDQPIDTSSPWGNMQRQMFEVFAELERVMLAERVKEGMEKAKAEGKRIGRKSLREAGGISEKVLSEAIAEAKGRVRATHRILRRRKVKVSLGWVSREIARRNRDVQKGAPSK